MKKFIISILFIFLFISCASTKSIEDPIKQELLNPTITKGIPDENKEIEEFILKYFYYNELVELGFNIHNLDYMTEFEIYDYLSSFLYNSDKTRLFLDGHAIVQYYDTEEKIQFNKKRFSLRVSFKNEYGTKDELLAKGYIENETMFYYPSNGEKDWRVGKWLFGEPSKEDIKEGYLKADTNISERDFLYEAELIKDGIFSYQETDNSLYLRYAFCSGYPPTKFLSIKKDNLILDLRCGGGTMTIEPFLEKLNDNFKKIIVIISSRSCSAPEVTVIKLREMPSIQNKLFIIGMDTEGCIRAGFYTNNSLVTKYYSKSRRLNLCLCNELGGIDYTNFFIESGYYVEGVGLKPDIWTRTLKDLIWNIINITNDYNLKFKKRY